MVIMYYNLTIRKKMIRVNSFHKNQIELATNVYNRIESSNISYLDVVLVSATSFDALKAAYPNYFTDISDFVLMMRRILT